MEKDFQECIAEQSLPVFDNQEPNLAETGGDPFKPHSDTSVSSLVFRGSTTGSWPDNL
jgi:hypothetical protein